MSCDSPNTFGEGRVVYGYTRDHRGNLSIRPSFSYPSRKKSLILRLPQRLLVSFWPEFSGSPLEVVHIFRPEYSDRNSPFHIWLTGSLPLLGNSVTKFKMTTAISIGWPDLIGKCRSINSIFLRYIRWSLTSQFGIIESTLDDDDFTPRGGGDSLLKRSGVLVVPP